MQWKTEVLLGNKCGLEETNPIKITAMDTFNFEAMVLA